MESSIRTNWLVATCLGIFAVCACVLVVSTVANVRQSLLLKQTHSDLDWIVMALHNYHDAHGSFPPAVVRDDSGNPIHSWRSLIQSEMKHIAETEDRFDAYDLSQPWYSQVNQESISHHRFGFHPYQMLAVVGPNAAWHPTRTRSISDFSDGTHNTLLLIAVRDSGVAWHEPVDAVVTASGTLSVNNRELDLSSDVFVATADGTVKSFLNGISDETLSVLLTIDAGDTIGDW